MRWPVVGDAADVCEGVRQRGFHEGVGGEVRAAATRDSVSAECFAVGLLSHHWQ